MNGGLERLGREGSSGVGKPWEVVLRTRGERHESSVEALRRDGRGQLVKTAWRRFQ